jgi:hypothetical protein
MSERVRHWFFERAGRRFCWFHFSNL